MAADGSDEDDEKEEGEEGADAGRDAGASPEPKGLAVAAVAGAELTVEMTITTGDEMFGCVGGVGREGGGKRGRRGGEREGV